MTRPLWQLAKKTLNYSENLTEFSQFLRNNHRQPHKGHSIDFPVMFMRVAVMMMFFQGELITSSWWIFIYFWAKVFLLFRAEVESRHAIQVVGMLAAFHLLDYITRFLPFMHLLFWFVNVHYLLFGSEQKYLSLNIMLLPMNWIPKSILITLVYIKFRILGIGKVKEAPSFARTIAYSDLVVFLCCGKVPQAASFFLIVLLVETIRVMDHRMIYTKKKFTHIDEIPSIEQYH